MTTTQQDAVEGRAQRSNLAQLESKPTAPEGYALVPLEILDGLVAVALDQPARMVLDLLDGVRGGVIRNDQP